MVVADLVVVAAVVVAVAVAAVVVFVVVAVAAFEPGIDHIVAWDIVGKA